MILRRDELIAYDHEAMRYHEHDSLSPIDPARKVGVTVVHMPFMRIGWLCGVMLMAQIPPAAQAESEPKPIAQNALPPA